MTDQQQTEKPSVSSHGYTDAYGPNVANILAGGTRVIRGRVPAAVRAELRKAVKDGVLGRLKKDGLKPEVFFHPDRKNGALERQAREAAYSVSCIAGVMHKPTNEEIVEQRLAALAKAESSHD